MATHLSWKHQYSAPSLSRNSNMARMRRYASSISSRLESSQGHDCVTCTHLALPPPYSVIINLCHVHLQSSFTSHCAAWTVQGQQHTHPCQGQPGTLHIPVMIIQVCH